MGSCKDRVGKCIMTQDSLTQFLKDVGGYVEPKSSKPIKGGKVVKLRKKQ